MLTIRLDDSESNYIIEQFGRREEKVHHYIDELNTHLNHPFISENMTQELMNVKKRYEMELKHINIISNKILISFDCE